MGAEKTKPIGTHVECPPTLLFERREGWTRRDDFFAGTEVVRASTEKKGNCYLDKRVGHNVNMLHPRQSQHYAWSYLANNGGTAAPTVLEDETARVVVNTKPPARGSRNVWQIVLQT